MFCFPRAKTYSWTLRLGSAQDQAWTSSQWTEKSIALVYYFYFVFMISHKNKTIWTNPWTGLLGFFVKGIGSLGPGKKGVTSVPKGQPLPGLPLGGELGHLWGRGEGCSGAAQPASQLSAGASDKRASSSSWSCDVSTLGSGLWVPTILRTALSVKLFKLSIPARLN